MKNIIFSIVCLFFTACTSETNDNQIKIGVVPAQTHGNFEHALNKLKVHLADRLNRKINIEVFPNYSGVVEALNYNKLDLAYLGPLTYVIAHEKTGAKAIITQEIENEPYYYSVIIAPKNSPLNSIVDVVKNSKDISVAFGSISSTSGYLIPSDEFIKNNIYQDENNHQFKSIQFAGSHDITALLVQNDKVNIGALDSAFLKKFIDEKQIDAEKIKIIWTSKKLYQYPWTASSKMNPRLIEEMQSAFIDIIDPEVLKAFGDASAFIKANDDNYKNIRDIAKARGLIK
jgi:phosphonate transport system substrate-binding protein